MFTTGSKFFVGATVTAFVATVVSWMTVGGQKGWTTTIGLFSLTVAFGFLAGLNFFLKDGNVPPMDTSAVAQAAANKPPVGSSMWPAITAVGGGLVALGAHSYPVVFKAGIVALGAAGVEWLVQGWSERASDSAQYNASLRKRVLHPLEFPVLAAVGLGVVIYSFSRIMLAIDKFGGRTAFLGIAAVVLLAGFVFSYRPGLKRSVVAGVSVIAAAGLVSAGAVAAVSGEKKIEVYPTVDHDPALAAAVCNTPGELTSGPEELIKHAEEFDKKASQKVSNTANLHATIVLTEEGELEAYQSGRQVERITVAMGNPVTFLLKNFNEEEHRFTARLGQFPIAGEDTVPAPELTCTPLLDERGESTLTLLYSKPSAANLEEGGFRIDVPGVEGQSIEVVVP